MSANPVKVCRKCKKLKSNYRHNKYSSDGLHDVCSDCDYNQYLKSSKLHIGMNERQV